MGIDEKNLNGEQEDIFSDPVFREEPDLLDLAMSVRELPRMEPPEGLARSIMSRLEPKRPSLLARLRNWFASPQTLTFTPWKLAPVAAVVVLLIVFAPYGPGEEKTSRPVRIEKPGQVNVVFTYKNGPASSVHLIGSFNDWNPTGYKMTYDAKIHGWVMEAPLPPGRHEYSFLIDNKTVVPDPKGPISVDDGFGNRNSVLYVGSGASI